MADEAGDVLKGRVPLSTAIEALRQELIQAWGDGYEQALRFKPLEVELTLEVAVTSGGRAHGGIKWWLVDAGGELARESVATQTVRMTLQPVGFDQNGQRFEEVFIDAEDDDTGIALSSSDDR
ncbi:trypco2 family protein [Nocardia jejuensis]|uniref:trypco2 family protein n=1 Tax=Nocardia jejuensis TaxID=328049 RepID=UPI000B146FD3|nr:trypco2 family protein [Nocardia jejuensis]